MSSSFVITILIDGEREKALRILVRRDVKLK